MFGLSHRMQLLVVLVAIVGFFCVWAKIDFAVTGFNGNYLVEDNLREYWFWMWAVGGVGFGFVLGLTYYAGAPDTESNLEYAVGIFFTPIILLLGQFEDFLYFLLNGWSFPVGDWTWMPHYEVLGFWSTEAHFVVLVCSFVVLVVMWSYLFGVFER